MIRKKIKVARQQMSAEDLITKSLVLKDIILQQTAFQRSQKIAAYWPMGGEIDPRPIIEKALNMGKKCYLPVVNETAKSLSFVAYNKETMLVPNAYGILEPENRLENASNKSNRKTSENTISPAELDLVLVPCVAFDEEGYRLGNGAGFYDRTFAFLFQMKSKKPKLWGLAFELQKVSKLPHDDWDVKLHAIITELNFLSFK